MPQLTQSFTQVQELLDRDQVQLDSAVLGDSSQGTVGLTDGATVPIINYTVFGADGNMTQDVSAGTITIPTNGTYRFVLFASAITATKDWEFQLFMEVDGTDHLMDAMFQSSQKSNIVSASVVASRPLLAGDVCRMKIGSIGKSVSVALENTTFEIARRK